MKKITVVAFFFILFNCAYSQTYYGYQERGNNSQVDWSKAGQNLTSTIQQEAARREELKKHYYEISIEAKETIVKNTELTNDNFTNEKILLLQQDVLSYLGSRYSQMASGFLSPSTYENTLKSVCANYASANSVLVKICTHMENKTESTSEIKDKNQLKNNYKELLSGILNYEIGTYNITCHISGFSESAVYRQNVDITHLYDFISVACDGKIEKFRDNWNQIVDREKKQIQETNEFNEKWKQMAYGIIQARNTKVGGLSIKEKTKYFKDEKKYLISFLGKRFIDWNFGTRRKDIESIDINISVLIPRLVNQSKKVESNDRVNLFYKYIAAFCQCGSFYDESIFVQ